MQQNTKINERFHSVRSGHFGVSTEREQRLVYFLFCNMRMKSYIRELENGYVSAPFCTYNTVLSSARTVVRYTAHSAERKSRPVWLLTRIPEIENRKRKRITFFQFYETLNSVDFFFFWLINKLKQQLDFAIPAHFLSLNHPKRYLLHLLVFLLI